MDPEFSNLPFLEYPDNSNQKSFPLDVIFSIEHCNFTLDFLNQFQIFLKIREIRLIPLYNQRSDGCAVVLFCIRYVNIVIMMHRCILLVRKQMHFVNIARCKHASFFLSLNRHQSCFPVMHYKARNLKLQHESWSVFFAHLASSFRAPPFSFLVTFVSLSKMSAGKV